MSNSLAIATVTAALRRRLQAVVARDLAGASVTTGRPEPPANPSAGPTINLFLYRVVPNPALRNHDLPTRTSQGTLLARPLAAVNLHFLLTFFGDETTLEPQRLMGIVIQELHSQPILSRKLILDTVRDPGAPHLKDSDLAQQVEPVKLQPLLFDTEELSKLWSSFQTRYTPSLAYVASTVLIEGDGVPQVSLPVRTLRLDVENARRPFIEQILCLPTGSEEVFEGQPVALGDTLVLVGHALRGDALGPDVETLVRIDALVISAGGSGGSDRELSFRLEDALPLRAGLHGVQVVHARRRGGELRPIVESNVEPLRLRPRIKELPSGGRPGGSDVTLRLSPRLGRGQRVLLLLHRLLPPNAPPGTSAPSQTLLVPPPTEDTDELRVPLAGVEAGTYLVRVQVDGVASLPTSDAQGRWDGPLVTVP